MICEIKKKLILQIHPNALCEQRQMDDTDYDYGWVGFVKMARGQSLHRRCSSIHDLVSKKLCMLNAHVQCAYSALYV